MIIAHSDNMEKKVLPCATVHACVRSFLEHFLDSSAAIFVALPISLFLWFFRTVLGFFVQFTRSGRCMRHVEEIRIHTRFGELECSVIRLVYSIEWTEKHIRIWKQWILNWICHQMCFNLRKWPVKARSKKIFAASLLHIASFFSPRQSECADEHEQAH